MKIIRNFTIVIYDTMIPTGTFSSCEVAIRFIVRGVADSKPRKSEDEAKPWALYRMTLANSQEENMPHRGRVTYIIFYHSAIISAILGSRDLLRTTVANYIIVMCCAESTIVGQ